MVSYGVQDDYGDSWGHCWVVAMMSLDSRNGVCMVVAMMFLDSGHGVVGWLLCSWIRGLVLLAGCYDIPGQETWCCYVVTMMSWIVGIALLGGCYNGSRLCSKVIVMMFLDNGHGVAVWLI